MMLVTIVATSSGIAGAVALYLASPNQQILEKPWNTRRGVIAGSALLVISLALFLTVLGPATSVFVLITLLMAIWSVPPLGIAYARRAKGKRR